ncbi:hypothetical protein BaRGS_00038819 [Batillaria attramentaria]|uniref:Uncharacterized protein n=1 Tax=Batillaria attramentaria TaxID=370345 RepID=A0ABD0J4S1_9CAEN
MTSSIPLMTSPTRPRPTDTALHLQRQLSRVSGYRPVLPESVQYPVCVVPAEPSHPPGARRCGSSPVSHALTEITGRRITR